jgi:hypothetical protein
VEVALLLNAAPESPNDPLRRPMINAPQAQQGHFSFEGRDWLRRWYSLNHL